MKQRVKGFILLLSIGFLIAYIASDYYTKRIDAEVAVYNQRLIILYNAHRVLYQTIAIQEGLYSFMYGTLKDTELVKAHFPELEQGIGGLSTSVSYIYYVGRADSLFRYYSHHVEVIETIYQKYIDKANLALMANNSLQREGYLKEAIESGEGLEALVTQLDKFLDLQYEKIDGSFPIMTERVKRIKDLTGVLFFISIIVSSYIMFYSCRPFKKTLLPFLKAIKAGNYDDANQVVMDDGEGCTREIVSTFNRIIEGIKEGEETYKSLTITDPLTGVSNRRYFDIRLADEMNRCLRYGTIFSLSLIDVDHFKEINDTMGHQIGDSVLVELAMLIKGNSRDTDIIARYGGEEFVIIYPCTPKSGVLSQIERLREIVADHKFKDLDRPMTISIGAADSAGKKSVDQVIQEADSNLYVAKSRGRNRCVIGGVTA